MKKGRGVAGKGRQGGREEKKKGEGRNKYLNFLPVSVLWGSLGKELEFSRRHFPHPSDLGFWFLLSSVGSPTHLPKGYEKESWAQGWGQYTQVYEVF